MCRIQVSLWLYAWRGLQDVGHCREGDKGLREAKEGLRGSMGDPRRNAELHEVNSIVSEECSYNHAVDCTEVRAEE